MEFVSILDREELDEELLGRRFPMPDFFLDLNIDQLLKLINDQAPGYDLSQMYYRFPADAEGEAYRREIYRDIKQPEVYACLDQFAQQMKSFAKARGNCLSLEMPLQKCAWHAAGAQIYCSAVTDLRDGIRKLSLKAEGLLSLSVYLNRYMETPGYQALSKAAAHIQQQMDRFHLILEIQNNKITVTQGTLGGEYDRFLGEKQERVAPFASTLRMSELEQELFSIFRKKYPALFEEIEAFPTSFPEIGDAALLRLEQELQYYLAFYRFEKKMEEWDIFLSEPETDNTKEMAAGGLYDLALACANFLQNKPVISNDFVYHEGERFFVVNGPNQGGKTTFARSLGQLVYFCKMGFDVPALWANVHDFSTLLTHFSVEESMETGQGKLMEELTRLAPMMKTGTKKAFVIINELFTTAAHYDGCIMGAKVLDHFIEADCRGIYVTHLRELGESIGHVVTMTAMLDGTKEHRRTYKILRNKAEEEGYAEDIVKKYELTYEQLKKRLEDGLKGGQG